MLTVRDIADSINYLIQNSKQGSVERRIYEEIQNENILICQFCCGFIDKTIPTCPHCYKEVYSGMITISYKEFSEEKVIDLINEGKYIGRYSRGEEIILEN